MRTSEPAIVMSAPCAAGESGAGVGRGVAAPGADVARDPHVAGGRGDVHGAAACCTRAGSGWRDAGGALGLDVAADVDRAAGREVDPGAVGVDRADADRPGRGDRHAAGVAAAASGRVEVAADGDLGPFERERAGVADRAGPRREVDARGERERARRAQRQRPAGGAAAVARALDEAGAKARVRAEVDRRGADRGVAAEPQLTVDVDEPVVQVPRDRLLLAVEQQQVAGVRRGSARRERGEHAAREQGRCACAPARGAGDLKERVNDDASARWRSAG